MNMIIHLFLGERLWPNPPKCIDTVADGMRMQQVGKITWPIILEHAEKHVFTVVGGSHLLPTSLIDCFVWKRSSC